MNDKVELECKKKGNDDGSAGLFLKATLSNHRQDISGVILWKISRFFMLCQHFKTDLLNTILETNILTKNVELLYAAMQYFRKVFLSHLI